jgi:hypothetical protein|tara:strand:+ start:2253 stop:2444 length:192 start_codon:yes stop_codon:yes gene_type:complete
MSRKKPEIGICRICKKEKKLTFEHIPPKVAFNKNTRSAKSPDFAEHKKSQKKSPAICGTFFTI